MIEIRPARPEEIPRQKEIWKRAFGDEDAYIDYFYDHQDVSQVLLLLEDGVIWTMSACLPTTLTLPEGQSVPSAYLYALATHPDARKRGYGRFMVRYVDFYLKERGMACVTTVPAEPSLHRYFASTGYTECFALRKVELLSDMTGAPAPEDALAPAGPAEYDAIRERLLAGSLHISYGEGLIAYQQGISQMARANLYRLTAGGETGVAAAEYLDDETVLVKELVLPPKAMAGGAALLAAELPGRRYHIRTPAHWEGLPGSYLQPYGMVKWYDPALEKEWLDQRRAYLGLGFD